MLHLHYQEFVAWMHANPQWAGLTAFLVAFAESIAILGTIIPGSITMTAVGILMGSGVIPVVSTLVLATLGAVFGDALSYLGGFYFKNRLVKIWPFSKHPNWLAHGNNFFKHHGGKSIFFGRFIGPIRAIIPIIAGMLNVKPFKFFPVDIIAAILWAPLYLLPGYLIGVAAVNLPKGVATRLILTFIAVLILFWLLVWIIRHLSRLVSHLVDQLSNFIWKRLHHSTSFRWLSYFLKDAYHPEDHGQLLLCLLCLTAIIGFILIFISVLNQHSYIKTLDIATYHFFRGYRAEAVDRTFVLIYSLGTRIALFSVSTLLVLWLVGHRYYWAAIHILVLTLVTAGLVLYIQTWHYVHRPIGIQLVITNSSFPSLQEALSTAIYGFCGWLICFEKPLWKKKVYSIIGLLISLITITELYLGFHWLSDILASFFIGSAIATACAVSYQRKLHPQPKPIALSVALIFSILFGSGLNLNIYGKQELVDATPVWDKKIVDTRSWWSLELQTVPVYRTSSLGSPVELLNIQWAAVSLSDIREELTLGGWKKIKTTFAQSIINELSQNKKISAVQILPSLYADQRPSLIMSKYEPKINKTVVIKLWPTHVTLTPEGYVLWAGTLNYDHPYGKSFFHKTYHLIPKSDAIAALTHTLRLDRWKVLVRPANRIPTQLLPESDAPHYIILLAPKHSH